MKVLNSECQQNEIPLSDTQTPPVHQSVDKRGQWKHRPTSGEMKTTDTGHSRGGKLQKL